MLLDSNNSSHTDIPSTTKHHLSRETSRAEYIYYVISEVAPLLSWYVRACLGPTVRRLRTPNILSHFSTVNTIQSVDVC